MVGGEDFGVFRVPEHAKHLIRELHAALRSHGAAHWKVECFEEWYLDGDGLAHVHIQDADGDEGRWIEGGSDG